MPTCFVKPKQSLSQNFLVDDNIGKKIVESLDIQTNDVVIEIGPGQGALTKHIARKTKHLIAIDIDRRIVEFLHKKFAASNVIILHGDFLETNIGEFYDRYSVKLRIVGNIPYHLTGPLLFKIFDNRSVVSDCTLMVQKEVAQRIVAKPGTKTYGILSVFAQLYGVPTLLFTVSPSCFFPKPNVVSAVVQIRFFDTLPYCVNELLFKNVVKTVFGKRRKTIRNSLKYLPLDSKEKHRILSKIDFPIEKRPEQLTVKQFVELTNLIEPYC